MTGSNKRKPYTSGGRRHATLGERREAKEASHRLLRRRGREALRNGREAADRISMGFID